MLTYTLSPPHPAPIPPWVGEMRLVRGRAGGAEPVLMGDGRGKGVASTAPEPLIRCEA